MSANNANPRHPFWFCFVFISMGIFFRFYGLDFDGGYHLHPDERFLSMVINKIEIPPSVIQYFDSTTSPLNPVNKGIEFYVYGDFPLFIGKVVSQAFGMDSYDKFLSIARPLAALADVVTLIILFLMARRWLGYMVGLMAAALYSQCVLPIQLAHFFTVDPFLNLFTTASLYFMMALYERPCLKYAILVGLFIGLAISCKISGLFLAPVYFAVLLFLYIRDKKKDQFLILSTLTLLFTLGVFRLFNPYAFANPNPLDFTFSKPFLNNLQKLSQISQPFSGFPPSLQWAFRSPVLYPLKNLASWGTGLCLFVTAIAGFVLSFYRLFLKRMYFLVAPISASLVLIATVAIYPVKTMRYLLPLYPLICFFGALFLHELVGKLRGTRVRCWPFIFVAFFTFCWALAFYSIFSRPMTRVEASQWMFKNIPAGKTVCTELWDDSLPLGNIGHSRLHFVRLNLTEKPGKQKIDNIVTALKQADYYIISSNRSYGPISRLKSFFPISARFYDMLFGNVAGYVLEKEFLAYPRIGPIVFPDDEAEEAFTVYDHPRVFIFKKTASFSSEEIRKELLSALGQEKKTSLEPSKTLIPVTLEYLKLMEGEGVVWLLRFLVLLIAADLAGSFLAGCLSFGKDFPSRCLIFLIGAFSYCFVLRFISPLQTVFPQLFFWSVVALSIRFLWTQGKLTRLIRIEGMIFWVVFAFFLLCRAHNPAIFWGERPMDFSLLNAMTRTLSYPPVDPWFAGDILRYHGWGQFFMAFLGKSVCIPPAHLYNMATALVPALTAELLFWIVRYISGRTWPAILAVVFVLLAGNLSVFHFQPWKGGLTFGDFWDASRVVPGSINEFPFWTSLFGDLHGHYIGMIFSLLFLACLFLFLREKKLYTWKWAAVAGLSFSALCLANPWALPVYSFVAVVLLMTKEFVKTAKFVSIAFLAGLVVGYPFWYLPVGNTTMSFSPEPVNCINFLMIFGGFLAVLAVWLQGFLDKSYRVLLYISFSIAILYLFPYAMTVSLILLAPLLAYLWRLDLDDKVVLPALLIFCALIILIGCDLFTLSDRMNTIFKYYFETWILFSIAIPVILSFRVTSKHHKVMIDMATFVIVMCMLTTSAFTFMAWWQNPKVESDGFTLNGLHYLLESDPDEAKAVAFFNGLQGQPVIVEAFGPSYGAFARISSFTGLPTVIGWEYHVFQHGHSMKEIKKREDDVKNLYTTKDPSVILGILKSYGIRYVYLGGLERKTYGLLAGKGFRKAGLRILMRSGQEEIWSSEEVL